MEVYSERPDVLEGEGEEGVQSSKSAISVAYLLVLTVSCDVDLFRTRQYV